MGNIFAAQIQAMEATIFCVESTVTQGYAGLQIIGNVSKICDDGKERAKAALEATGFSIPAKRIVVSISPADQRKDGSQFDLPIAICILEQILESKTRLQHERWLFAGELGLNGEIRPVKGAIPFALAAARFGLDGMIISEDNIDEVATLHKLDAPAFQNFQILAAKTFAEVIQWLKVSDEFSQNELRKPIPRHHQAEEHSFTYDDMELSPPLELAALTAASGKHNVLLRGVPGSGKSMWAQRLPSILSPLPSTHHLEVLNIHSIHNYHLASRILAGLPPARSPHHQASSAALIGGLDHPGDLSLAHRGVLFLDEITEFRRDLLEALREPLETGIVHLSRSKAKVVWHANVLLIAACNNCPCGWFGSPVRRCSCSVQTLLNYQRKLSGPLLDRIDMHLYFDKPAANVSQIFIQEQESHVKTKRLQDLVKRTQEFSRSRNQQFDIHYNSELKADHIFLASGMSERTFKSTLEQVFKNHLSTRSQIRVLRVARTLADLEAAAVIAESHVRQALAWHYQGRPSAGGLPS